MFADVMKRPQASYATNEVLGEASSEERSDAQMENTAKQARVIPVQHEQVPSRNQQWQQHNPNNMPQPRGLSYAGMQQPAQAQQQYQQQYAYPQQPYPQQQYQQRQQYQQQQPRFQQAAATRQPTRNQSPGQRPAERTVPIRVVHESPVSDRTATPPPNNQRQTRTVPVSKTPSAKSPSPTPGGAVPTSSTSETNPASAAAAETKVSNDDHRVVAARQRISEIVADLEDQENEVNTFQGSRSDKTFLKLEHLLTNKLLNLDEVNASGAPGEEAVRAERKAAIRRVQQTLDILELKVMSE